MRYLPLILVILSSLLSGCFHDRGDTELTQTPTDSSVTPNSFLTFVNQSLDINSEAYAMAYYKDIDLMVGNRTTLAGWKAANGFNAGEDVHVTFRDTLDLGYGRDMYAREFPDGNVSIYVDNYVVEAVPGDATAYGPLNLEAAVQQNRDYHFGTNAIEYSEDVNGEKILKFFTFAPRDENGVQNRLLSIDLDGRGVKFMPSNCVVCHGATMYPLKQDASFDPISLKSAKFNILRQNTFEFSDDPGFTEADQKDGIAAINRMVYKTYVEMGDRADAVDDQANWNSDFARELLEIAYGDMTPRSELIPPPMGSNELNLDADFQTDSIPEGWKQTPQRPGGVEILYKQVIEPHCAGCHSLRGTKVAKLNPDLNTGQLPNSVNFSSYEEFIGYDELIVDYVFKRGAMPRSLINYSKFWEDPNGSPSLLASFLPGFDIFDGNNGDPVVIEPGKSVAMPGTDRTVASTPVTLDATASMFTDTYSWQISSIKPPTASASLNDSSNSAPELTADDGAVVELELTTSNTKGSSVPVTVVITVDSLFAPSAPTFDPHIRNLLANDTNRQACTVCHSAGVGGILGIPVYYDEGSYSDAKDLYRHVLNRVDLNDPENSLLLRKPTSLQHGGGMVLDRSDPPRNSEYIAILNWIRDGAPCGNSSTLCD